MYELHDGERIKDVKKFEGIYAVTDQGRVWSYKRDKWLSPYTPQNGYAIVCLYKRRIEANRMVHRLVGEAFIKNPHDKPYINHLNGIKTDNRASNLSWVTSRENNQHACDHGLNSHYILSLKDKITICQMYERCDVTKSYIAKVYKLSPAGIHYIINAYGNQVGHA